jgi:hypothetical protein
MPEIPPQLRDFARAVFSGLDKEHPPCGDCGGVHARECPRISSVRAVINEKGVVVEREVSYWAPGTWEKYGIIWPEDVYEDDDASSSD